MITVHMIGNAHLDPVWLWPREDGVDTVLATARSACDRLDEYPEFVFTCSTSWFHEQVAVIDPVLFARIRAHVASGRWQLVGGMPVQPDCNFPSAETFDAMLADGQDYYRHRFGRTTTVGYNVDSFGHTAYLPRFLRAAGMDAYVFMRPGAHAKELPGRVFRWCSPDGHAVTAFRIAEHYNTTQEQLPDMIAAAMQGLPSGITHTMCFYGVGDHGGGPTKANIEWIQEHADAIAGARLEFSHPRAFFDAVAPQADVLPVVEGELQFHAIGCYSVERDIRVALRAAESGIRRAQGAAGALAAHVTDADRALLVSAREKLHFNTFHDILGGTSVRSASLRAVGELRTAAAEACTAMTCITRRAVRDAAEPGLHKLVIFNPSEAPFRGLLGYEPFVHWTFRDFRLVDERGEPVPRQWVHAESVTRMRGMLFPSELEPGGMRVYRIEALDERPAPPEEGIFRVADDGLSDGQSEVTVGADAIDLHGWQVRLDLCADHADTWGDKSGRCDDTVVDRVTWRERQVVERGPLRAGVRVGGEAGGSRFWMRLLLADDGMLELHLRVVWAAVQQRLRLRIEAPGVLTERVDLVSGGALARPLDGMEYPLNGGLSVACGSGARLGIAAPDVYSLSVGERNLDLTLLRSAFVAHHDPETLDTVLPGTEPDRHDQWVTDQGQHAFHLRLGPDAAIDVVAAVSRMMQTPPLVWSLTG